MSFFASFAIFAVKALDRKGRQEKPSVPMSEHIVSAKTNIAVWLVLLVLTGVTAGVAFIDLGPFNTIVALVIATVKALLVVLIFMHVKYTGDKLVKVVVISAVFFLLLLLGLSLADYTTRMLI
jgi:cytochrome c oxidase subunit IV